MTNPIKILSLLAVFSIAALGVDGTAHAAPLRALAPLADALQNTPDAPKSQAVESLIDGPARIAQLTLSPEENGKTSELAALHAASEFTSPAGGKQRFARRFKSLTSRMGDDQGRSLRAKAANRNLLASMSLRLAPQASELTATPQEPKAKLSL